MSESNSTTTKGLRFGPLVRVSTERQERQGESLVVQRKAIERDVEKLGGTIAGWYGGQEHATPGWERKEVDRQIADAGKKKFDAVIVCYADRWSRDNKKSKEGLEVFRKHGIRFFIGATEYDLFSPETRLILGVHAEIGEFVAGQQSKKSIESKIERARKGWPACGSLPFGRTFNRLTGQWHVIPEKQAMIREAAERYLRGDRLEDLSKDYHRDRANLTRILRERCGDTWVQEFNYPRFNIDEKIITVVPELLDADLIKKIRHRLTASRTYLHTPPRSVHDWLLRGRIFCAACGTTLIGQAVRGMRGKRLMRRYYRHIRRAGHDRQCPLRPRPNVPADKIEAEVLRQLHGMLGNPAQMARAIKASIPDCDAAEKRQARLQEDLVRLGRSRERVLKLVADGDVTMEHAKKQLADLKDREARLRDELGRLAAALADAPTATEIDHWWEWLATKHRPFEEMDRHDQRLLIAAFLNTPLADGRPAGVYVEPPDDARTHRPKAWAITIRGRFDFELVMRGLPSAP
jgi:DNA invertase Pin-like site-specific DNA recombinase